MSNIMGDHLNPGALRNERKRDIEKSVHTELIELVTEWYLMGMIKLSFTRVHQSPQDHGMQRYSPRFYSSRSLPLSYLAFSPLAICSLCSRDRLMGLDSMTSASNPTGDFIL